MQHKLYMERKFPHVTKKLKQPLPSVIVLSFTPPPFLFFASLNARLISGIIETKMPQTETGRKNSAERSACVCPLGWERWVNKGRKKEDPAEIKRLCLQWVCNYNGSRYISTLNMVGWRSPWEEEEGRQRHAGEKVVSKSGAVTVKESTCEIVLFPENRQC